MVTDPTHAPPLRTPVLIVGGGPVGFALSIDLSWRGVPHMLVERDPRSARLDHPRMDQVGIRSMEHFRRLGLVAAVEAAGYPRHRGRDVVFATGVLGEELAREPFEADATRPCPPFSPQKHELCPQNFLDPVLQAAAEAAGHADIRYATRLTALREDGTHVACGLLDAETGAHREVRAAYVAGCDGSGSAVAGFLGIGARDSTTLARSTNIFINCPGLRQHAAAADAYRFILIGTEGVWASMVNIDGGDTWRLQVLGAAGRADWTQAAARAAVERAIGLPIDYRLGAIVPWARRELIADRFGAGRCFLLGDAAHQFSPTGGYGMNTGLAESFDLSWKLAATLAGWGGPHLLASYEEERRPVAVRNAQRATVNFQRMLATKSDPALLAASPEGVAVRRRIGAEMRDRMSEEWESMGIHLGYGYAGSSITVDDRATAGQGASRQDEPNQDDSARYAPSTRPGARAPHAWLADGRSTLDLFGHNFVLMDFGGVGAAELLAAAARRGVPMRHERLEDVEVARLYEARLVLVRPDGHVAMRADRIDTDPDAIVERIRGAAPSRTTVSATRSPDALAGAPLRGGVGQRSPA